jgi:hypothetical protein
MNRNTPNGPYPTKVPTHPGERMIPVHPGERIVPQPTPPLRPPVKK